MLLFLKFCAVFFLLITSHVRMWKSKKNLTWKSDLFSEWISHFSDYQICPAFWEEAFCLLFVDLSKDLWRNSQELHLLKIRGQKLFWVHWNLFFKLLKHGHFWMKKQSSELPEFFTKTWKISNWIMPSAFICIETYFYQKDQENNGYQ